MAARGAGFNDVPMIRIPSPSDEPDPFNSPSIPSSAATSPIFPSGPPSPGLSSSIASLASSKSRDSAPSTPVPKIAAGLQPDASYRRILSPFRYHLRQWLLRSLEREMPYLPAVQFRCRAWGGPRLDSIMIQSSWLGSHTFFMLFLPLGYWFGHASFSNGLVYILASSVFVTGSVKDLVCVPRPYSPPLVRLSIGNHAAEYGFPSTHSATSFGSALWMLELLWTRPSSSAVTSAIGVGLVTIYIVVLVFGRLYCGMHSLQDVFFGSLIGLLVWGIYSLLARLIEALASQPSPLVPLLSTILALVLITAHPQPVDDCPCFEDSTAFVAVALGVTLAQWCKSALPIPQSAYSDLVTNSHPFHNLQTSALFAFVSLAKISIGIASIFIWRIAAKSVLSRFLPPIFRAIQPALQIPRRHYVPATDYDRYEQKDEGAIIPSVLNLPSLGSHASVEDAGATTSRLHPSLQNRKLGSFDVDPLVVATGRTRQKGVEGSRGEKGGSASEVKEERPEHYDVDVLMRIIVYAGIGFLSVYPLPYFFVLTGLT